MEIVEFNVQIEPRVGAASQAVRYSAEFINGKGERITLTREKHVETEMLRDPYSAAWLLSHILRDFMSEASAK